MHNAGYSVRLALTYVFSVNCSELIQSLWSSGSVRQSVELVVKSSIPVKQEFRERSFGDFMDCRLMVAV